METTNPAAEAAEAVRNLGRLARPLDALFAGRGWTVDARDTTVLVRIEGYDDIVGDLDDLDDITDQIGVDQ